jgi:hypothetical protein
MKSIRKIICNYIATSSDLKNKISILLLFVLLVYTSGVFIAFKFMEYQKKLEMKAFLKANPNSYLTSNFTFCTQDIKQNNTNFEWEEVGKEFKFNGEMYDVLNTITSKDSVQYLVIKDAGENKLLLHYASLLKHQTNKKSNSASILKLLSSVFICINNEEIIISYQLNLVHCSYYIASSASIILAVVAPPPQV